MSTDPPDNASAQPEDQAKNPYAPPGLDDLSLVRQSAGGSSINPDVQPVPDATFWVISWTLLGVMLLGMLLFYDSAVPIILPFFLSTLMGVIRVCFVYSRRARAGLLPLSSSSLLLTSTLISFAILVSAAVTFFAACSITLIVFGLPNARIGIPILLGTAVASLALSTYLFVRSFELAV